MSLIEKFKSLNKFGKLFILSVIIIAVGMILSAIINYNFPFLNILP